MTPYFMGFQAPVVQSRLAAFLEGKMDIWEIAIFFQDCIEASLIPVLVAQADARFYEHALWYCEQCLCTADSTRLH